MNVIKKPDVITGLSFFDTAVIFLQVAGRNANCLLESILLFERILIS